MKARINKIFTLLTVLLFGFGQMWAADPVENVGTYSTQVISADGTTSTWTFITPGSQVTIPTSPAETEDNDIIFHPGGGSKMKFSSSNGLSWSGNSDGYVYVPAGAAGSISMTVKSASDSRWLQLYVDGVDQGSTKRLWSKEANPATEARGPRTFTFTSSDLTTKGEKTYLHLKDNNTEMKIATFTVTLTTGNYLSGGGGSSDPVASVTVAGGTTGYATVPVALTATPDETATAFKWFVDNVEQSGQSSATFNFTAATPGTYSIVAKARNDNNETDEWIASDAHTVTISKLCGELVKIVLTGNKDGNVSGILTGTKDVSTSTTTSTYEAHTGYKIGSNGQYVGITGLSKPLRAGDVATVYVTTASAKLQLFSDKGTTLIGEMTSGVAQGENEIVLNSSATGATAIYLYRTSATGSDMNPYVYSLSVNRSCEASTDCSISNVTINSEAITPVGKVYSYEVAAASALTEVAVTYSIHPLATAVPASGFTVAVPTAGDPANTQTITVTAEDGTHSDTYTISVSKATAASDVVTLDALAVTGYTLSPTFDAATLAYTITKDYGTADPTTDKVTYTKSEDAQKVEVNYDGTNHKFVVTVTAEDNTTTQDYEITINEAEAKRGLLTVPFSNGAKGAINAAGLEIRVPYIGASEPTVVLANIEYQSGVSGASASMESDKLRITGADSNYDDYTLTFVQLTPSALTLNEEVTFDAVPSYAFAPYGWDSDKGVKFAKKVEDGTPRVSSGNTRVYFAIQDCDEVQLTSGSGGARNVNIYVNGVLSSVDKTAASGSAIKLALDNTQANFIAIESNQTGGDGGFTKILVKALAANTLAYDNGAYTTGDAALDLSTLISTYNSDAAITYAVKTDGGTNASISGNNFTAIVAGTAVVTATQVASETIRQASVDFNVVVTAGATKYTVTFDAQGGSAVDPQQVTEGGSPVEPTAPTKDEYIFKGWAESAGASVSDVVDVTSFTINAPKIFYAVWEAEPAGIKLLDGSTVNHTNFITGVTADETVEFKGNTVNYAKFSGTCSGVNSVKDLTRVIAYNATTNKTKIRISAHNNSTSARNILVKGLVEGADAAVDLATIALGNKEDKVSDWIEFNNAANRTIYIMVSSSAGDVYFTQVKVIEDGTTPMKQVGEAGYSLNLNKGRFFGTASTDLAFEGLNARLSGDYTALNSGYAKIKETSMSFTVASAMTLSVTTNNNKTYYVTKGAAGTDNETAKTGVSEFNLTAGTWYITGGTAEVQITNIAFSAPKCEQPTVVDMENIGLCEGDAFTALTVSASVTDGGTLHYQWFKHPAEGDDEAVGTDAATYTPTADGQYYVVVTNQLADHSDNSKTSNMVTVEHFASAEITTAPAIQRKEAGQLATLTVVATGKAPLTYQWYTCDDEAGSNPVIIEGADEATYEVTVTVGMSQYYKVVVGSGCGSAEAVTLVEEWHEVAPANVTGSRTWDWAAENMGTIETVSGSTEYLMANVSSQVPNTEAFRSDMLYITANYANRSASNKFFQGWQIRFYTEVAGKVSLNCRAIHGTMSVTINGTVIDAAKGSDMGNATTPFFVPAGWVTIAFDNQSSGYEGEAARVQKIVFNTTPDYSRDVTEGRYGTICLPNGGVMVGAMLYEVAYFGETSQKIFFDNIPSGEMEAGIPYVFLPNDGVSQLAVYYTDDANASATNRNGLYGSYTREELPSDGSCYILLNNQYCQVLSAENYVGANKAYFKLGDITPTAPALAPGRIRMSIGAAAPQVATGIDQITNDQLQMTDKVIIDGRLFIIRGEKMYDATGRLVK